MKWGIIFGNRKTFVTAIPLFTSASWVRIGFLELWTTWILKINDKYKTLTSYNIVFIPESYFSFLSLRELYYDKLWRKLLNFFCTLVF